VKKILVLVLFALTMVGGAFAGSSKIELTPPVLTKLTVATSLGSQDIPAATLSQVNTQIGTLFTKLQDQLNNDYFSKLNDLTKLSKGFANANQATFDNATLMSFQNYDLFALMFGFNLGLALPSLDLAKAMASLEEVSSTGDAYLGLATGGFAGQFGLNAGFLVPNMYLSGKLGFIPSFKLPAGSGVEVEFAQGMFGLGANYNLYPKLDILFGLINWRGLSVGSGFVYNSNTTKVTLGLKDYTSDPTSVALGVSGVTNPQITAKLSNIKAALTVENSSFVIPIEIMTSLQALWFLNVGLGAGVDVAFSGSNIKLAGGSDLDLLGLQQATFTPGTAKVTATDSKAGGDFLVPRLAGSLGMNIAIFKLEVPVSVYPTTGATTIGFNVGAVW